MSKNISIIDTDEVPDNYFNEKLESEKEWLDIASSLMTGGFSNLTDVKVSTTVFNQVEIDW